MTNEITSFVSSLASVFFEDCFNPYYHTCDIYDLKNAPEIRRDNLLCILNALAVQPKVDVWVGRDLGYRGGRRTGLALTDEYNLGGYARHLKLNSLEKSTLGPSVKERTADNIFKVLDNVETSVLTWNVFPFHPHTKDQPFTNRMHSKYEAKVGIQFLQTLCAILPVNRIIAIGNDAAKWTNDLFPNQSVHVRHPSYGGQNIFLAQMSEIYGSSNRIYSEPLLL